MTKKIGGWMGFEIWRSKSQNPTKQLGFGIFKPGKHVSAELTYSVHVDFMLKMVGF